MTSNAIMSFWLWMSSKLKPQIKPQVGRTQDTIRSLIIKKL